METIGSFAYETQNQSGISPPIIIIITDMENINETRDEPDTPRREN
jgi:hypothetical protein